MASDFQFQGRAALLTIRNVAKSFGKNIVLRDISLEIAEGEFLTILGESGSGKTTLLRIIAGFETRECRRNLDGRGAIWTGSLLIDAA